MENPFENLDSPIHRKGSLSGKTSPLDFLAQASYDMGEKPSSRGKQWITTGTDGRERIAVVPGPSGISIRLHKGSGRLPNVDVAKPFAKKCRNRECNNLGGQIGKPRSIYCSKRCQSREQNLRQGRIKNVRSPSYGKQDASPQPQSHDAATRSTSSSPRSSPSPNPGMSSPPMMMTSNSPTPDQNRLLVQQQVQQQQNYHMTHHMISNNAMNNNSMMFNPLQLPFPMPSMPMGTSPSPSPLMMMPPNHPSSPIPLSFSSTSLSGITNGLTPLHMLSASPLLHTLPPSPLTLRLGMTPSPIPVSPSPLLQNNGSFPQQFGHGHITTPTPPPGTFSPILNHMTSPIPHHATQDLPIPTKTAPIAVPAHPAPVRPQARPPSTNSTINVVPSIDSGTFFSPHASSQKSSSHDNLTLAPIRS
eukprot:TRINITY_DN10656_c0_g1_i1.p1 TRINITY_DN10656_c0_g1~~TRINITY_DN10656_c0_g1_i1.p1  ORF type:complete len:417 (-),score=34.17 TRINITY_DN10656_c0_g1_i1:102-1352(-)